MNEYSVADYRALGVGGSNTGETAPRLWSYVVYELAENTDNLIERARVMAESHEAAALTYLTRSETNDQESDIGKEFVVVDADEVVGPFYLRDGQVKQELTVEEVVNVTLSN